MNEKVKVFILTDGCMWEKNKQEGTRFAHAIEVVDMETGQVRFIKSGSKISFIEGEISEAHTQEAYNNQVLPDGKDKLPRKNGKRGGKKDEAKSL